MRAKEALKILGVTRPTLHRYVKQGLVKIDSTINGQHIYNDESIYTLMGKKLPNQNDNKL